MLQEGAKDVYRAAKEGAMKFLKPLILTPVAMLITLTFGAGPALSAPTNVCTQEAFTNLGLTDEQFGKPVIISSVAVVGASGAIPSHCVVRGTIWPEIGFAVKLPTGWNGNFYMVGGGGWNGTINEGTSPADGFTSSMVPALVKRYATAGTDSGHSVAKDGPLTTFAYNPPDNSNPNALQKKLDFAYRSYHETARLAKELIKAYYGNAARFSYFAGCSEGGRQALLFAQRFPDDFDGIYAGSPLAILPRKHMWDVWVAQALLGEGSISVDQMPILAAAVYNKCDSIDGLVDGLIDDPRKCKFDPAKDLPRCPMDIASPTCFTTGQIGALNKIYGGVKNSAGVLLFPGLPLGAEILAPASGWVFWMIPPPDPTFGAIYGLASMQFISLTPQPGPTWKLTDFNFDTDPARLEESSELLDTVNPDLSRFKSRGGKMIHLHGWADTPIPSHVSVNYYNSVLKSVLQSMGGTTEFYKLYMVPGGFHCGGGAGCFDSAGDPTNTIFPALVDWVEKGIEPGAFVGHRVVNNAVVRTRPLCPYPEVARYLGKGSIDDAANFTCVDIVGTAVRIEPATLKVGSQGKFTATLTIPKGYDVKKFSAVTAEGALAVETTFTQNGRALKATFNRQDLINITAGEDVVFTVTAIFAHQGRDVAFEGSVNVNVKE